MLKFSVVCFILSSLLQFDAVLTSSTGHLCHPHESISLLQFKKGMLNLNSSSSSSFCDDIGQYSYPKMISWNKTSTQDCCTWDGVECHGITGYVIGLQLSCSRLKGFIHQNSSLFLLSHLEKLNLAFNDFSFSKVSPNIGRLSLLSHLNFSYSGFEGIIPSDLSHLSKLVLLDLSDNEHLRFNPGNFHILLRNLSRVRVLCLNFVKIVDNIPANWSSSSITYLNLGYTELRGKLPKSIFHLIRLRKLLLDDNQNLSVNLPNSKRSNTSALQVLDLCSTNINADEFSDSIHSFAQLKSLRLSDCEFTGSFPNSIANLTQIVELDLSLNDFRGDISSVFSNLPGKLAVLILDWNSFTGQFPYHVGNLTQLGLSHNFLNGTLPFTMSVFPKLTFLDLSGNAFHGEIPCWLFSSPSMTHLDLSTNFLTGQLIEFTEKSLVLINLSSNNFSGSIDFTIFKNLSILELLSLSNNKLSFRIEDKSNVSFPDLLYMGLSSCQITKFPSFLTNSKNLQFLDLSNNKLIGQIPYMIPRYPLRYLNLSHNSLSGLESLSTIYRPGSLNTVPLIKSLKVLDLSSNKFQELLPLSICIFKHLYILDLARNNFLGAIPKCYGLFSGVLQVLNLERNDLDGIISMNFRKDNGLMYLNLKGNSLQGTLPTSLGNCKNLIVIDVGKNMIKDAFPNLLENLTNLRVLILKFNRFFGNLTNVKNEIFCPKLQVFDLSFNDFSGALPLELFHSFRAMKTWNKILRKPRYRVPEDQFYRYPIIFSMKGGTLQLNGVLTTLVAIDLSSNNFVGEIPKTLANLNSLNVLNLSHNKFSGPIPSTMGELHSLESLDLSFNLFKGMIPWQLVNLTFLEILNLSHNRFVGRIPQGKQFNTFLDDSYSGNLGLCGFPLIVKCADRNPSLYPSQVSPYEVDDDSSLWFEFTWRALISGFIFGMAFGYFLFFIGKPRWLTKNTEEQCWYSFLSLVRRKNKSPQLKEIKQ